MDPVLMPQIGQDITVGRIVRWFKHEMDPVEAGEVIVTVESEKASFDVEAERSGVLLKILYGEGEEAEVLAPVAYIGEAKETAAGQSTPGGAAADGRPYASPSARRIASEQGISLQGIRGSGPGGRIVKKDMLEAAVSAGTDRVIPFTTVRKIIAERLTLSSRTIPHFYLFQDIDMQAALSLRAEINGSGDVHVSVTDLVAHAVVQVLGSVPRLNAHVESDRIVEKSQVHLGLAVDSERGLVVPVIPAANGKSLEQLARELKQKTADARSGRLQTMERGTFTITSLGMFGVPAFLPIINPPECAILSVGAIERRVVAVNDAIAVRPLMTVALGCDHRAADGAEAARFLRELKEKLEGSPSADNR